MTYKELQDAVADKVKDTSASIVAMIPDVINEAVQQITDEVPMPSLKLVGTVSTVVSQEWVNITSTITSFSGRILYAGTTDGELTVMDGGLEELYAKYYDLDEDGDLEAVALEGNILWYYKTPATATSITLVYYAYPTTMIADGDTPSDLPSLLHRDLIVNKAASIIFDQIEEGVEGEKVATASCLSQYNAAVLRLRGWLNRRRPNVGRSYWSV